MGDRFQLRSLTCSSLHTKEYKCKYFYLFFENLDKIILVIGPIHVSSYDDLDGQRYSESSLQSCFNAFIVVMKLVATVISFLVQ